MEANYICLKCNYEWNGKPGPIDCPKCLNHYVKWVNYEEWREWSEKEGFYNRD
jgi:rubrerythrin